MAFRRADQTAQSVIIILVNPACGSVSCMKKSQYLAFGSVHPIICSARLESERAQVQRDIVQSIKECLHESKHPHRAHLSSTAIFLCLRTSLVGRECFASLHKKTFILDGTWIRQREVHYFSTFFVSDEAADPRAKLP